MADIKNKNELKRRTELFLDEFSHEEYIANEDFCKDTMRMMREFIGRTCHLLDCKDARIEKVKKNARAKAIDEVINQLETEVESCKKFIMEYDNSLVQRAYCKGLQDALKIAKNLKGGAE